MQTTERLGLRVIEDSDLLSAEPLRENAAIVEEHLGDCVDTKPATFTFAEGDWTEGTDGNYTITVAASVHQRKSAVFGYSFLHLVDGAYKGNTWAAIGTNPKYDSATGNIVMTTPDAYAGAVVFYG